MRSGVLRIGGVTAQFVQLCTIMTLRRDGGRNIGVAPLCYVSTNAISKELRGIS